MVYSQLGLADSKLEGHSSRQHHRAIECLFWAGQWGLEGGSEQGQVAQGRPWQGQPKIGSEEKTQPSTAVGDGLGWTRGTRIPAPPAAALTSSSPGGPRLCVSPLTHTFLAPTGTKTVTTLSELLFQVSNPASSAWATLRVCPE